MERTCLKTCIYGVFSVCKEQCFFVRVKQNVVLHLFYTWRYPVSGQKKLTL